MDNPIYLLPSVVGVIGSLLAIVVGARSLTLRPRMRTLSRWASEESTAEPDPVRRMELDRLGAWATGRNLVSVRNPGGTPTDWAFPLLGGPIGVVLLEAWSGLFWAFLVLSFVGGAVATLELVDLHRQRVEATRQYMRAAPIPRVVSKHLTSYSDLSQTERSVAIAIPGIILAFGVAINVAVDYPVASGLVMGFGLVLLGYCLSFLRDMTLKPLTEGAA